MIISQLDAAHLLLCTQSMITMMKRLTPEIYADVRQHTNAAMEKAGIDVRYPESQRNYLITLEALAQRRQREAVTPGNAT